ncbi:MAG: tyrosine-type recombinase/integrase, partial [Clostridia bacterium]|nr:tyrosine-type recombinase/integrase [Clostridia bacterium]
MKKFDISSIKNDDSPIVLKNFLGYIRNIKGQSSKTVSEYFFDIRTFLRFLKLNRGLVEIDADDEFKFENISIKDVDANFLNNITLTELYEYLDFTIKERKNNSSTRARKISSLRSFFKYLNKKAMVIDNNIVSELEFPKPKRSLPHYLTLEQAKELLNSVDGDNKERDYCILVLFLNCGMRLSELAALNVSDIRSDSTVRITGKGNKERILFLNEACTSALKDYLMVRPADNLKDSDSRSA